PSVSRLDGAAAVEAGYTTLGGLLSSAPGVYATEQSGEGSQASLFIRGMNSTHTAVLLDGRRLPQGFSGSYELGRYRVYGLSSIELLRGPASTAAAPSRRETEGEASARSDACRVSTTTVSGRRAGA
ncbi:MAG: TonB-dependent receptor, partial [Verrucomicrobiota bacterium]